MTLTANTFGDWLQFAATIGCIGLLVAAAIGDVRHYRISNRLVGAVIVCFAILAAGKASWIFLAWSLAAAACTLLIAALLFAFGLFGGGDTKLAAAMALWTQFADLPRFLLVMTASGGILGVVWMIRRRMQRRHAAPGADDTATAAAPTAESSVAQRTDRLPNRLPYGVAIAAAGIDFFLFSPNSPLAGVLSGQ
jgi:prepilin peptidase CpaA